ncbi:hypothetical protein ACWEJ6_48420 [Nonomuraea sp. NPDC004702]
MTSGFSPVPLIGTGPNLLSDIQAWIVSDPLRALVAAFGGGELLTEQADRDLGERIAVMDAFTDRWDTRRGRERNLADELPMTAAQADLVLDAALALGLYTTRAPLR